MNELLRWKRRARLLYEAKHDTPGGPKLSKAEQGSRLRRVCPYGEVNVMPASCGRHCAALAFDQLEPGYTTTATT